MMKVCQSCIHPAQGAVSGLPESKGAHSAEAAKLRAHSNHPAPWVCPGETVARNAVKGRQNAYLKGRFRDFMTFESNKRNFFCMKCNPYLLLGKHIYTAPH